MSKTISKMTHVSIIDNNTPGHMVKGEMSSARKSYLPLRERDNHGENITLTEYI
jgi:hypothetical protein